MDNFIDFTPYGIIYHITLDVACGSSRNVIKVKQNDISRIIKVYVEEGGKKLFTTIDNVSNDTITLRVQRPDGKLILSEKNIKWDIEEGTRTFNGQEIPLTSEMLSVSGIAYCDFLFKYRFTFGSTYEDYDFSTEGFYIDIEPSPQAVSQGTTTPYKPYNETQSESISDSVTEVQV
jgi:hypothetical protein